MKTVKFTLKDKWNGIYKCLSDDDDHSGTYVLLTEAEAEIAALRERERVLDDTLRLRDKQLIAALKHQRVLVEALEAYKQERCEDPIRERITPTKYKEEWILYDCTKCKSCKVRAALAAKEV